MKEISCLDFLKLVHVLLTWHIVLEAMKVQFIVCKHVFDSLAVKGQTSFWETMDNYAT